MASRHGPYLNTALRPVVPIFFGITQRMLGMTRTFGGAECEAKPGENKRNAVTFA